MLENSLFEREKIIKQEIIERLVVALLEKDLKILEMLTEWLAPDPEKADRFEDAHKKHDTEMFSEFFQNLSIRELLEAAHFNGVDLKELNYSNVDIDGASLDLKTCDAYINQKDHSLAVSIAHPGKQHTLSTASLDASKPFAIHSVGKVFTGVLMLKMIQNGTISKEALHQQPQLDEAVLERLLSKPKIKEQLEKCTLLDLMTHKAGLGDYVMPYIEGLSDNISLRQQIPEINSPLDFIDFFEDKIYELDNINPLSGEREHYSNIGLLLVGMVIEYAYNMDPSTDPKPLTYDQILRKYIIDPANLDSFSNKNPGDGITNPSDSIAPHIVGSPAGGYWLTVNDLGKFGQWLIEQEKDDSFMELLEKYGKEFYDPKRKVIAHVGDIPSSSAQLTCYLKTGTTVAVLSNMPSQAGDFILAIQTLHARDQQERESVSPQERDILNVDDKSQKRASALVSHYQSHIDNDRGEQERKSVLQKPSGPKNENKFREK